MPLFTVRWKKAGLDVNLYEETWFGHILPRHSEDMRGKLQLIRSALQYCLDEGAVVQWAGSPGTDWFIQYACQHFKPYNDFLRVSIKIVDKATAIVTSAYPVKELPSEKEIKHYEPR